MRQPQQPISRHVGAGPQPPLLAGASGCCSQAAARAWVCGVGLRMGQVARSEASLACSTRTTATVPAHVEWRTPNSGACTCRAGLGTDAAALICQPPSAAEVPIHACHPWDPARWLPNRPNTKTRARPHTATKAHGSRRGGAAPALRLATWWYSRSRASPWCRCHSSSSSGWPASKPEPRGGGGSACGGAGGEWGNGGAGLSNSQAWRGGRQRAASQPTESHQRLVSCTEKLMRCNQPPQNPHRCLRLDDQRGSPLHQRRQVGETAPPTRRAARVPRRFGHGPGQLKGLARIVQVEGWAIHPAGAARQRTSGLAPAVYSLAPAVFRIPSCPCNASTCAAQAVDRCAAAPCCPPCVRP